MNLENITVDRRNFVIIGILFFDLIKSRNIPIGKNSYIIEKNIYYLNYSILFFLIVISN